MRRHYFVWFLVIAMLLTTGAQCKGGDTIFQKNGGVGVAGTEYFQGTKGLTIDTLENQPPSEIFEGTDFKITAELKNEGAADIENGKISLVAFADNDNLEIDSEDRQSFVLQGLSEDNPFASRNLVEWDLRNTRIPATKKMDFAIRGCYEYKTTASLPVCISPSSTSKLGPEGCTMKSVSSSGQGAPVAVTGIKPSKMSKTGDTFNVRFEITIQNKGDGLVREVETTGCLGESKVLVNDIMISGKSLSKGEIDCKMPVQKEKEEGDEDEDTGKVEIKEVKMPSSITLKQKKATLFCTSEFDVGLGSFTTPMVIDLSYGYLTQKKLSVRVKGFE